ncbi:hypothetical protein [Mesorhizobium sp. M0522]|uniref:hypothetical protein n=1 Tax=Mesorhizobium sp. M0522 TaxID=2956958 RepID=UPI00333C4FF3
MSANLAELTDCIASALHFPLPTARLISRLGREREILTHGGRGRSVPKATSVDAANLLIAFMVCPTPARATEFMKDFGDLRLSPSFMHFGDDAGPTLKRTFQPGQTFRDSIAAAIDLLGSSEFAAEFDLKAHVGDERPGDDPDVTPVIDISIIDTYVQGELNINGSNFHFLHPALNRTQAQDPADDVGEARSGIAEAALAIDHYRSPIRSERTLEVASLLPIAELLHGRSFVSLLNERFDREQAATVKSAERSHAPG